MLLRLGAVVEIELFEEGQRDSPGERRSRPRAAQSRRRRAAPDVRTLAGRADTSTRTPPHSLPRSRFLMPEAARQQGPALFPSGVVCDRFRIDGVLGVGAPARSSARSTSSARKWWRSRPSRTTRRCASARAAKRRSPASCGTPTSCACAACTRTGSTSTSHPTSSRASTWPARYARGSSATPPCCASPRRSAPGSRTHTSTASCIATSSRRTCCSAATAACAYSTSASPCSTSPTRRSTTACWGRSPTWPPRRVRAAGPSRQPTSGPWA